MPVAKAAVTGGLVITASPEITAAAAAVAMEVAATVEGVTAAAGVAATDASTLAPVVYPQRRLFRFIPV